MSLFAAIHVAVLKQLVEDNRPEPIKMTVKMGADLHYNVLTMGNFLEGVAKKLHDDTPSYKCNWGQLIIDTCLADDVILLEGYIASVTT